MSGRRPKGWRDPTVIGVGIILAGALLRIRAFAADLSLWGDELTAAIHLLGMPHHPLLESWVANQPAPVLFVWLTRGSLALLGVSEASLRLVPFLASLTALPLFGWLAIRWMGARASLPPLVVFAFDPVLIRYAAELKPYAVDVLVTCALLVLAVVAPRSPRLRWVLLCVGLVVPWLSYPGIFVLGAVGAIRVIEAAREGDRSRLRRTLLESLVWTVSFAGSYLLVTRAAAASPWLLHFWRSKQAFWSPVPPSLESLVWPLERLLALFGDPAGFARAPAPAAGLFLLGTVTLLRRDPRRGALLLGPLVLALVASALEKYPVHGRLMLFAVPVLALGLGEGARLVITASSRPWLRAGAILAVGALLALPVLSSLSGSLRPPAISETRPVLAEVMAHRQPGDVLYAFPYALPAIAFYGPRVGLDDMEVVPALRQRASPRPLQESLGAIPPGTRVWFVMADVPDLDFTENEREILAELETRGRLLGVYRAPGATAYLFQLGKE